MSPEELDKHLHSLFEGQLQKPERQDLEEELRQNPQARDVYWESLMLHHSLRYRSKGTDLTKVVPMDQVIARNRKRAVWRALSAAAAVLLIGVVFLALNMADELRPTITFQTSSGARFALTHTQAEDEVPQGLALEPGSRLVVDHGSVELDFASGIRSVVTGPAAFTVIRDDLIKLDRGKAWFDVPSEAVGFQVMTPDLVLTDLGTRFGVVSRPDAQDEAHVFEGRIELLHRRGGKANLEVAVGEARSAKPDGSWREIPLREDFFPTKLPEVSSVPVRVTDSTAFTSSPNNQMVGPPYRFLADTDLDGFSAADTDKLVVTLSHEHGSIREVTFEGLSLSLAVESRSSQCSTAIYYLDEPPPSGNLEVFVDGRCNGMAGSIIALANSQRGKPHAVRAESGTTLSLRSAASDSLAIASLVANEDPAVRPKPKQPWNVVFGGPSGSCAGASGFLELAKPGTFTASFQSKGQPSAIAVAVFGPTY